MWLEEFPVFLMKIKANIYKNYNIAELKAHCFYLRFAKVLV
jgi:hypothetical protein